MYEQNNIVSGGQSDTSKDNEESEGDQNRQTEKEEMIRFILAPGSIRSQIGEKVRVGDH